MTIIFQLLQWGRDREVAEFVPAVEKDLAGLMLQWGRDREVAEFVLSLLLFPTETPLQWGRDREVAELIGVYPAYARTQ